MNIGSIVLANKKKYTSFPGFPRGDNRITNPRYTRQRKDGAHHRNTAQEVYCLIQEDVRQLQMAHDPVLKSKCLTIGINPPKSATKPYTSKMIPMTGQPSSRMKIPPRKQAVPFNLST